jgi:MFS transporter, ACS family, tartrate transporter
MADDSISVGIRTRRRISRRLLPFLLVLFLLAFIDRTNIGLVAKPMAADLGFSEAVIGTGAGIFFIGYFLLEIPGTLIVERWSARKWISRIMISWGIIATLMGFIGLPMFEAIGLKQQFYGLRFILGLAEAGFFPGIIIYLSHWFRYEDRAKTKSLFLIGIPLANIISAPISNWIMYKVNWLELTGWRWVFILEGLPSILFGVITWFYLTDRPEQAKWLPEDEKAWIVQTLAEERASKLAQQPTSMWASLWNPYVLLLSGIYLFAVTGMYGFTFFYPSITGELKLPIGLQTILVMLPHVFGFVAILLNGAHSDRTLERRWHTALPLLLASLMIFLAAIFAGQPMIATSAMCALGLTLYAYIPVFWTHPTLRLSAASAAVAVGFINSIGNLGGFFGPLVVGYLKTETKSFTAGLFFMSACVLIAGILATFLDSGRRKQFEENKGASDRSNLSET